MQELMNVKIKRITHTSHSRSCPIPLVVDGASIRHLVDQGGADLKFGKPKSEFDSSPSLVSLSEIELESSQSEIESAFYVPSAFCHKILISTLSHNRTHYVFEKNDLGLHYAICMTRSNFNILYELDPEIDRTLHRLRKVRSTLVSNNGSSNFVSNSDNSVSATNDSNFSECSSFNVNSDFNFVVSKSQEPEPMENND
ncbi:hypothetical protein CR513_17502, partial [Mucuna pruriens]